MRTLQTFTIREMMTGLRDMWSRTNKIDFLNTFFSGWDEDDPSEYYHNKWIVFRASPLQFWCSCDSEKQHILHEEILKQILRSKEGGDDFILTHNSF